MDIVYNSFIVGKRLAYLCREPWFDWRDLGEITKNKKTKKEVELDRDSNKRPLDALRLTP
jgi:hypothetical protein